MTKTIVVKKRSGKTMVLKRQSKPRVAKVSKPMRAAIERVVNGEIETKYVVENEGNGYGPYQVANELNSVFTAQGNMQNLQTFIPPISSGPDSAQLSGSKITNVRGATHFEFELIPPVQGADPTRNVVVVLYLLESKSAKSVQALKNLPQSDLLRKGQSSTNDWDNASGLRALQLLNEPLGTAWRGTKKVFHFTKNQGTVQGDAGANQGPNTLPGGNRKSYTHRWSREMLRYDEASNGSLFGVSPINYAPCWGVVAYYSDGTNLVPVTPQQGMGVNVSWRSEMYYKDA